MREAGYEGIRRSVKQGGCGILLKSLGLETACLSVAAFPGATGRAEE